MKTIFKLSAITMALMAGMTHAATHTITGTTLASNANDVAINVNSDDGVIGDFVITNGSANSLVTFDNALSSTSIYAYSGSVTSATEVASLTLDSSGLTLTNGSGGSIKVTGVADGTVSSTSTDAVNGSQLYAVQQSVSAATDSITALQAADVTLQSNIDSETAARTAADTTLQNNIDSEAATRAAADTTLQSNIDSEAATRAAADTTLQTNIDNETTARIAGDAQTLASAQSYADAGDAATLKSANAYTDSRLNTMKNEYRAAVASSIAIASLPQPTQAGMSMVSAGTGAWDGETGYAVGVSGVTENNKWIYKAAATSNSRGDFGGGIAVGFQWK